MGAPWGRDAVERDDGVISVGRMTLGEATWGDGEYQMRVGLGDVCTAQGVASECECHHGATTGVGGAHVGDEVTEGIDKVDRGAGDWV